MSSISARPTGCRYATIASTSSAAAESLAGRAANAARSMASAKIGSVVICHPPATSANSTPWPSAS